MRVTKFQNGAKRDDFADTRTHIIFDSLLAGTPLRFRELSSTITLILTVSIYIILYKIFVFI